ncbi:MAG: valine--tRNA ligase [Actinobacteria bacterium]|nr:valine--tRNA ligase [Actinomycetota bacterium]
MKTQRKYEIPEKPTLEGIEAKWMERWEADGIFRFDRSKGRDEIFAVDTPPPTVSGSLHVGSGMSYTHTDLIVRYQRMRGKEPFYPMGWDDNGLPTERRVQNFFGVRCDPSLPYDPEFQPPPTASDVPIAISRPNFIELCSRLTLEDEKVMEGVWRELGLSVDWSMTYATIDERSRCISQKSFLRLLDRGLAYQAEGGTYWDVDYGSAVAQAELEDREIAGAMHRVRFHGLEAEDVLIETTRPELIPACVALVAHPDDDRFKDLFDSYVSSPLFGSKLPIKAHELADPEKGTGIAMICTFGDTTDVQWWRELSLPMRSVILPDGTFRQVTWGEEGWDSLDHDRAQRYYDDLVGLDSKRARRRVVEMLRGSGDLVGEPQPITHSVKFYERGERPLEIVTSRQWYIKVLDFKEEFIQRGREVDWHPDFMRVRYEDWVNGLNVDWGISRQRYFGVPFPVWYAISDEGTVDYEKRILPDESKLPVDPSTDVPPGYAEDQRGQPGGFIGDPDVMDTWATSALTPQIGGRWDDDPELFEKVFPMDLRPQGHDIIRTWLFVTIVRSHFEHDSVPWKNAAISGMVTDPDRKKMSKSKGNIVTPMHYIQQFGSDAFRYWAAGGRPGMDGVVDEGQMKIGRRLAIKILNASKFVLSQVGEQGDITEEIDLSMLAVLGKVVEDSTTAFDNYDYTRALDRTETFFWTFCDDYLELVKARSYGSMGAGPAASANRALTTALSTIQRLFAPFMPYVTEEVWSWWRDGSIHRAPWPTPQELQTGGNPELLDVTGEVLGEIRRKKSDAKVSLKAEVSSIRIRDTKPRLDLLGRTEGDLKAAGNIAVIEFEEGEPSVDVTLA